MGKLVWLASYPKSGNTWLRAFLHNLLLDPPAPVPLNELVRFCHQDSDAQWFQAALDGRADKVEQYQSDNARRTSDLTREEVARLRPLTHEILTRTHPDSVFVKTHNALLVDRGTSTITMAHTAGAIYVVRNPLDVAISYADHLGVSIDDAIGQLGRNMETANTDKAVYEYRASWSSHVESWTRVSHPGLHVVRYEDLSEKPEEAFRAICRFLGLNSSPERLAKAIRFSSFDQLSRQEATEGFRERTAAQERFFRKGQVGGWREVLTPAQAARIVGRHGAQMARFGYKI
jgi:hypothetical protein